MLFLFRKNLSCSRDSAALFTAILPLKTAPRPLAIAYKSQSQIVNPCLITRDHETSMVPKINPYPAGAAPLRRSVRRCVNRLLCAYGRVFLQRMSPPLCRCLRFFCRGCPLISAGATGKMRVFLQRLSPPFCRCHRQNV